MLVKVFRFGNIPVFFFVFNPFFDLFTGIFPAKRAKIATDKTLLSGSLKSNIFQRAFSKILPLYLISTILNQNQKLLIMVYEFERSDVPVRYSVEDSIPVAIWSGKCRVDLKKIYKRLEFMF